jgi:hypothetical protein
VPKKPRDFVDIIEEQVRLYETCAEYLRLPQPDPTLRKIALASLHGQGGRRSKIEPPQDARVGKAFAAFMDAMMHRITDEEEPWQVRQLVNVTSKERLEQIRERQLSTDGPHYEVRALVDPHSLNVFSPLIISDCHVFLALDDQKYFRASSALHFGTPKMARWMLRYFDSLWDRAPFRLRDQAGVDETEVDRLVSALNSFELAQETSDARAFIRKVEVPEQSATERPDDLLRRLIDSGESERLEFKQSLEYVVPEVNPNIPPDRLKQKHAETQKAVVHSALKTICAFLNTHGGTLLIGVHDDGSIIGIEPDLQMLGKKKSVDEFQLKIQSLIRERFTYKPHNLVRISFHTFEDGLTICRVDVKADSHTEHYLDGSLYVREGNNTEELKGPQLAVWLKRRSSLIGAAPAGD